MSEWLAIIRGNYELCKNREGWVVKEREEEEMRQAEGADLEVFF